MTASDTAGSDEMHSGSGPLAGLRILDLTQFLAGPYATMIFADLDAEVIKLEAPVGDWSRVLPPNFVGEESCYYLSINRNKQSIVVDMKNEGGLEVVRRLADESDILVENFRPGVLDRLEAAPQAPRRVGQLAPGLAAVRAAPHLVAVPVVRPAAQDEQRPGMLDRLEAPPPAPRRCSNLSP